MNHTIQSEWALKAAPELAQLYAHDADRARESRKSQDRIDALNFECIDWCDRHQSLLAAARRLDALLKPIANCEVVECHRWGEGGPALKFDDGSMIHVIPTLARVRVVYHTGMARFAAPALAEWLGFEVTT